MSLVAVSYAWKLKVCSLQIKAVYFLYLSSKMDLSRSGSTTHRIHCVVSYGALSACNAML